MLDPRALTAFRYSENLVFAVYAATDAFPPAASPSQVRRLRGMTTAISGCILDASARSGPPACGGWRTAALLLGRLAEALGDAEAAGWLGPDGLLELLEVQTGALVAVLELAEDWREQNRRPKNRPDGHPNLDSHPNSVHERTCDWRQAA